MNIQPTNPLHLYRALLREATYLFDHNARVWTQGYIRSSFRDRVQKTKDGEEWKTSSYEPKRIPSLDERHQLKRGRKFLVLLQRANQGYQRHLKSILQLAYGRKGRRKRALTALLLRPDLVQRKSSLSEGENESSLQQDAQNPPVKFSKEWKAPANFISLIHAQNQLSSYLSVRKQLKSKPQIAEKNRWGRPMPACRIKNTTKDWYAKMAAAILPPLPEGEWDHLKAVALRKEQLELIPRRPTAKRMDENEEFDKAETVANTIISGIQRGESRRILSCVQNPHNLTPRFLSRFYARHILNHTSVAVPNPDGKGLISKWDDGNRDVLPPAKPKDQSQIDALFG